jgi:hypothetical protein
VPGSIVTSSAGEQERATTQTARRSVLLRKCPVIKVRPRELIKAKRTYVLGDITQCSKRRFVLLEEISSAFSSRHPLEALQYVISLWQLGGHHIR